MSEGDTGHVPSGPQDASESAPEQAPEQAPEEPPEKASEKAPRKARRRGRWMRRTTTALVLLVLAAGAGMAKPVLTPKRGAQARVILVDVSRSARDSIAIRDSVRSVYRDGDAVVVFDSSTRLLSGDISAGIDSLRPTIRRGNLSAALIAALRARSAWRFSIAVVMMSLAAPGAAFSKLGGAAV